jgi:hypothetical protein
VHTLSKLGEILTLLSAGEASEEKTEAEIQAEIQSVFRQITASVTFLPMLDGNCTFNVLVYADADSEVPLEWGDSDAKEIKNGEKVQLRSFSTSNHRVDTLVSYRSNVLIFQACRLSLFVFELQGLFIPFQHLTFPICSFWRTEYAGCSMYSRFQETRLPHSSKSHTKVLIIHQWQPDSCPRVSPTPTFRKLVLRPDPEGLTVLLVRKPIFVVGR